MVSALCLAWLFTVSLSNSQELVPGQVYNTGNLTTFNQNGTNITQPWQNVGQWGGQLTCWGPGNPGYCGPNPYVNANGQGVINFSYGYTDLYQVVNIANALPNSGTGLRVNGFNFGFMAKNGNGWDNGQQDYLVAYVNFYDTTGKTTQSYNYGSDTNRKYNWTQFNFNETFTAPYASKDLGTVRYGFVGYDTNYWSGPYGPEIYNVSFRLKYSVDPCFVNILSSPSCPGYLEALNKLSPKSTTNDTTTVTNVSSNNTAPSTSSTVPASSEVVAAATVPTTTSTVTQPVNSTSTASASVTPTATNPQPKVGEVTVSGSPAKTPISTSQILAIVRNEQSRISSVEQSASTQAVAQAQAVAANAVSESMSISAATMQQSTAQSQAALSFTNTPQNISGNQQFQSNASNNNQTIGNANNQQSFARNNIYSLLAPSQIANSYAPTVSISAISVLPKQDSYKLSIEENIRTEGMKFNGTDFIASAINNMPAINTETRENTSISVNQQVQDNELAGGISIASIARQPIGFDAYSQVLRDAAFYAPKEIYRNQNVVDNARAQRGLLGGSDRLHQEMVDSQYNRK